MRLIWGCCILLSTVCECQYREATYEHYHNHVHANNSVSNGCRNLRAPCVCSQFEVTCVNAQFTDTDVFLSIDRQFDYLTHVTFQGNNFRRLPPAIFGKGFQHDRLVMLNLSSNYIVHLDEMALMHSPSLETLDIKDNEIVLAGNETKFLSHTPKLRQLFLRRAFNPNTNRTHLINNLEQMFKVANLKELTVLDLSYNALTTLPYQLGCYFPKLQKLDLSVNQLRTLKLNGSCFPHLDTLNLQYNSFTQLGLEFRLTAANLPDYCILAADNRYLCDCNAHAYISWLKATIKIQDRDRILCFKASPELYDRQPIMKVPLKELNCDKNLTSSITRYYSPMELQHGIWAIITWVTVLLVIVRT